MPRTPWWAVVPQALLAIVAATSPSEAIRALAAAPAVLWLPGWGIACALAADLPGRLVTAFWVSALGAIPVVAVAIVTGGGPLLVLGAMAALGVAGAWMADREERVGTPLRTPLRFGLVCVAVAALATAWSDRFVVCRPLDAYWWFAPAEAAWEGREASTAPTRGGGWEGMESLGWSEAGAFVLDPKTDHGFLLGPAEGPIVFAVRGPVGATLTVGDQTVTIERDVTVDEAEGPVARYLDRGVAGLLTTLSLARGEHLPLTMSAPDDSLVYVLPSADAVWALHESGALRYVHYYQLLNMVEQLRWVRELGHTRWVTDVQPPLWTWVQAAPLTVTGGELPTENVVLLLLVTVIAVATLGAFDAWAPDAPLLAWALPAVALQEHTKLLLEPGSAGLPDTIYTLAALAALTALRRDDRAFLGLGLLAQLARYPGTFLVGLGAALDGRWRLLGRLCGVVFASALVFGVGGWFSGSLDGWLATVTWETGPEHWHGNTDPVELLARVVPFYETWLAYAGALPLLVGLGALVVALRGERSGPALRGARVWGGTAALYSLLLCTIDHSPSHYFLPLLHLPVVALACVASGLPGRWTRVAFAATAVAGLWISVTGVPISG